MADFTSDGCADGAAVSPVYLKVPGIGKLATIFPTHYNQKNHCSLLGSPSEKGLTQFDNKVLQPTTIQFTGIVKNANKDVITTIRTIMKKIKLQAILCLFQSKAGQVDKMIIESIEEIGESQRYDGIEIRVCLQEYLEHNVLKQ